jgi:penicillin-binding protein 1A
VVEYSAPFGVINVGGDWYYEEYGPGNGVRALGLNDPSPGAAASDSPAGGGANTASPAMAPEDRRSILDLFRN